MEQEYAPKLGDKEVSQVISKLGIKKTNTKLWQLLVLGVLAGLYISFGGQLFLVTVASGMSEVIGGVMFSVGLILVVIAGAELFTGNVTIIIGVLSGVIKKRKMLANWVTVYIGNFLGSILFAWFMSRSGLFGTPGALNDLGEMAAQVAAAKLAIPFWQAVIRAVFCNMLVILAIIMSVMAKDIVSKIFAIVFPIAAFVACGFEHSVANMFLIPIGMLMEGASLFGTLEAFQNILPVTLGNLIGGILILVMHPNRIRQIQVLVAGNGKGKAGG
jgi:formate/nitrite transporter